MRKFAIASNQQLTFWDPCKMSIMNKSGEQWSILSQDSFLSLILRYLFQKLSDLHLICRLLQASSILTTRTIKNRLWEEYDKQSGDRWLRNKSGGSVKLGHITLAAIVISTMKPLRLFWNKMWYHRSINIVLVSIDILYTVYINILWGL